MRAHVAVLVALVATGCVHYSGGAHAIDPSRVAGDGWIVVDTPTVHQVGRTDCGPAALAMVAGRWRVALDRAQIAREAPSKNGVRLDALRDVARAHGLSAYAIAGDAAVLEHELRAGRPVIVGLYRPYGRDRALAHYEVVIALHPATRTNATQVVTIDPGARASPGWQVRDWPALEVEWRPAGHPTLVVLGPRTSASTVQLGSAGE